MLREQFRQSVRNALIRQGVTLPLEGPLSLTLTLHVGGCCDDYPDADNLLTGVMSSLDDVAFAHQPKLLRDDRAIRSVHVLIENI